MATYFTRTFSEMIQFSPPYVSPIIGTIFLIIAIILIWKYKKNDLSLKFLILRLLLVSVSFIYTMGVLIITRIEAIPWSIYERGCCKTRFATPSSKYSEGLLVILIILTDCRSFPVYDIVLPGNTVKILVTVPTI